MSEIWKLYRKPQRQGEVVPDVRGIGEVRYYTGNEYFDLDNTRQPEFYGKMGLLYSIGLASYIYCTKKGLSSQRFTSTLILTAVPLIILFSRKGDDASWGGPRRLSLEEKLEFYPVTRRALERAIEDVANES